MSIEADALGQLLLSLVILDALIAIATWIVARDRVHAPRLVAGCNFALGLFPPLNLLALTLLAMLPARPGKTA